MQSLKEQTITILTVSFNSSLHLKRLFYNIINKSDKPNNIKFLVIDNTNGKDKKLYSLFDKKDNVKIIKNNCHSSQRSISHASGLDNGLKNIDTDFTLILDPDIHIFMENWDLFCIKKITLNEKTVIGAPYPQWKLGKVHDYPSVVFMFFKTDLVKHFCKTFYPFSSPLLRIIKSIMRKIIRLGGIANKKNMDRFNFIRSFCSNLEKLTGISSPDTGKEIIEEFRKNNFQSIVFDTPYKSDLIGNNEAELSKLAEDFEVFLYQDDPFMTHMYSSGVYHWRTHNSSNLKFWQTLIYNVERKTPKVS